jgi:predicted metalloprotease
MESRSLYRAAHDAAEAYRRDVVKRLGQGHNSAAVAEWNQQRFWLWVVDRAIEHVEGTVFWHECGRRNFSRVSQRPELATAIRKLRKLQSRLHVEGLPTFKQKEEILKELARCANLLLE